jgi:hypothetical protein
MRKIDWLIIFFITVLSIFALRDLLKPGYYTSHDGIHQVPRLYYFDQDIRDGQIPPRWAGGLLDGFGYPLFIFSYHMPWFIAEPIHLLGFSIFDSIKLTFILGFLFSGITMFYLQKLLFGRFAAFVGTIIYLFAPFRFSNIFVRAAIGDATIFIFPPLFLLALLKIKEGKKINLLWISLGAIALSGMLLSHAMVAVFYFLCFALYIFYTILSNHNRKIIFTSSIILLLLAFCLSGYYLIPSFWERNLTRFAEIMGPVHIGNKFISLSKLIYSPWGYGTVDAYEGAMSLQVGIAQWFTAIIAAIILIKSIIKKERAKYSDGVFFLCIFILSIILMLKISLPFWKVISNIVIVDFPWRILSLTVFSVSILAGFAISMVHRKVFKFAIALIFITLAFYANRNHLRINQSLDWPLDFYLKLERTTNTYDEYTPKWVQSEAVKKFTTKVESAIAGAKISIDKNKSNYLSFIFDAPADGVVRINTVYYPGWQVFVDGKRTEVSYNNGLIEFQVKKGKSKVVSQFTETPLRQFSNLLTAAAIGFIILSFVKYKKI